MTNEQAIQTLCANVMVACERARFDKATCSLVEQALDMAIEALSCSEKPNRSDLISKQDAIEECKLEFLNPNVERETEELTLIDQSFAKGWNQANSIWIKALEKLSSSQPYTEEEIQAMQDLEQAQLDKAYELGWKEGRKALREEIWEDGRDRLD